MQEETEIHRHSSQEAPQLYGRILDSVSYLLFVRSFSFYLRAFSVFLFVCVRVCVREILYVEKE